MGRVLNPEKLDIALEEARRVLEVEATSILKLKESIDNVFRSVLELILASKGRVVFIGMGKSGLICKKLAATFSSTGTPAFFVHAGEALHGDLGMITCEDLIITLSNSGETEEVLQLIPAIRRIGAKLVVITGNRKSSLARHADYALFAGVKEEASLYGLAPTASTTASMALGDALSVALSILKGFTKEDFALLHPGGSLGRRLLTRVQDVMKIREQNPMVREDAPVKEALFAMTSSKMGATSVVDRDGKLLGIITDGDVRRHLEDSIDFFQLLCREVMTSKPVTITPDRLAAEALKIMEEREIKDLPVVCSEERPLGLLNFQDLLRAKVL